MKETRMWLMATVALTIGLGLPPVCQSMAGAADKDDVLDVGGSLELFVDKCLVSEMKGVGLKLNPLQPAASSSPTALTGHYATILKDGDICRFYCRRDGTAKTWAARHKGEITLYAESRDGIHWTQPDLNLYPNTMVGGVPVPKNAVLANVPPANHNFTPFKDARPGVPRDEQYKALGGHFRPPEGWLRKTQGDAAVEESKQLPGGLASFVSPDGIHWKKLKQDAVTCEQKAFDSQNVSFWSVAEQQYVCYFRIFDRGPGDKRGCRAVARTTSKDFLNWTRPTIMKGRAPNEEWYTNGTHPYFRAPHIYIAPATRYLEKEATNTRVILMTTRAGSDTYDRSFGQEDFVPDPDPGNRRNYIAWNSVQTGPRELSFYRLGKRYTLRLDGFGSVHADDNVGELITKPLKFSGRRLLVNFKTRGDGCLQVELLDAAGSPIPGWTIQDNVPLSGDEIEKEVAWKDGSDLGRWSGKPIRLRLVMKRADLYALRFVGEM